MAYETCRFNVTIIKTLQKFLSRNESTQSLTMAPISLRSILMLPSQQNLYFLKGLFPLLFFSDSTTMHFLLFQLYSMEHISHHLKVCQGILMRNTRDLCWWSWVCWIISGGRPLFNLIVPLTQLIFKVEFQQFSLDLNSCPDRHNNFNQHKVKKCENSFICDFLLTAVWIFKFLLSLPLQEITASAKKSHWFDL